MPTVKSYQRTQELQPLRVPRDSAALTPESAGAGIGGQIAKIGLQLYEDELLRQDQVAVIEAERKLSQWELKRLYDPKNGALTQRGKDAFGLPDAIDAEYAQVVGDIDKSLSTERQRVTFSRAALARRADINKTLTVHVFNEVRKHDDIETENFLSNARQAAIANSGDPQRVNTEIERQSAAVADYAVRNGLGGEYVKQKTAQVRSDTHVGVVDRLLANGMDMQANNYVEAHRAEFAGDDIAKVEKWVEDGSLRGEAQRTSDDILRHYATEKDARSEAQKLKEPKLRDEVTTRIGIEFEKRRQIDAQEREEITRQSAEIIDRTGTVDKIPPAMWDRLNLNERAGLKAYARSIESGEKIKTDYRKYYEFVTEASTPELQAKFMQRNLMADARPYLANDDFKYIVGVQAALRKGDDKAADKLLINERMQTQIVNDAMVQIGLDPTPTDKTLETMRNKSLNFRRIVRERVRSHEMRTGKPATDVEVQKIVDDMVVHGKVPGSGYFFDDRKHEYELKPGERLIVKAKDIPQSDRSQIEAALRNNGRVVTEEAVVELYNAKLNAGRQPQKPAIAPKLQTQKPQQQFRNERGPVVDQIPRPTPRAAPPVVAPIPRMTDSEKKASEKKIRDIDERNKAREKRIKEIDERLKKLPK